MNKYRPTYHFLPEKNWMNDPNGPLYYNDEYHLFYQHNPHGDKWGTIHWGHAKSKDLVHWEHLPLALYPSQHLGEEHCFSGCAVISDGGIPIIFYTSVGTGDRHQSVGPEQWMAVSHDHMTTWDKPSVNPILTLKAHGDLDIREWRDPFVFKEGNTWYMVLGGSHNKIGCALIYSSHDLISWQFLNKLYEDQEGHEIWECPNLFQLGDKYVLLYSPSNIVKYYVGTLNDDFTFTPESSGVIDYSGWEGFYAPNSLIDNKNRRIMWGWLTENARGDFNEIEGWAGVQSVPRVITLENNTLKIQPAEELKTLRTEHTAVKDRSLSSESLLLDLKGRALEIEAQFELTDSTAEFGLKVLQSEDGEEETVIHFNLEKQEFAILREKSSQSELPHKFPLTGKLTELSNKISVRLFVDHSTLEVFVIDQDCLSTRVYPIGDDSIYTSVYASKGSTVTLTSLDGWQLKSIY